MSALISVVTLTHNKLDYTRRCLAGHLQTGYSPWELVVVDNGSTDGTREWLEEFQALAAQSGVAVHIILNEGNIGCSTARNQGAARAGGEHIVFVDNDVAPRNRAWLSRLADVLDAEDTAGIVGPKLVYPFPPHAIQCAGVAVSRSGRVQFLGRGEQRDDLRFNKRHDVQCLISACFMIKRSVFEAAGGFDQAFDPVEYEDLDLCYRARSLGYRTIVEPAVEMYHFESVTTAGTASLPNTYLIIKHGLLFKKRWRHMFANEDGPADNETGWRQIPVRPLEEVDALPIVD